VIFAETVVLFLATVLISYVCGYGAVTLLLPDEYREYRFIVMPPIGYTIFSWGAYTLSGSLGLSGKLSCQLTFIFLALLGVIAIWCDDRYANGFRFSMG
jgi:hypothetical protein